MNGAIRHDLALACGAGAMALEFRLAVNGQPVKDARTMESLKNTARSLFQALDTAEWEAQVFQIYNAQHQVVLESRNNRQWRLVWKTPRKAVLAVEPTGGPRRLRRDIAVPENMAG